MAFVPGWGEGFLLLVWSNAKGGGSPWLAMM